MDCQGMQDSMGQEWGEFHMSRDDKICIFFKICEWDVHVHFEQRFLTAVLFHCSVLFC